MRRVSLISILAIIVIFGSSGICHGKWTFLLLAEHPNYGNGRINDSGQVVWWGAGNATDSEIYFYDGDTITQLTDNTFDDRLPEINNLGHVAWVGNVGNQYWVFLYDGSAITQIAGFVEYYSGSADSSLRISDSGYVLGADTGRQTLCSPAVEMKNVWRAADPKVPRRSANAR
jgi:hypothetical protein